MDLCGHALDVRNGGMPLGRLRVVKRLQILQGTTDARAAECDHFPSAQLGIHVKRA